MNGHDIAHEASALRLISAVLAEIHEEWLTGRQYLNLAGKRLVEHHPILGDVHRHASLCGRLQQLQHLESGSR